MKFNFMSFALIIVLLIIVIELLLIWGYIVSASFPLWVLLIPFVAGMGICIVVFWFCFIFYSLH